MDEREIWPMGVDWVEAGRRASRAVAWVLTRQVLTEFSEAVHNRAAEMMQARASEMAASAWDGGGRPWRAEVMRKAAKWWRER